MNSLIGAVSKIVHSSSRLRNATLVVVVERRNWEFLQPFHSTATTSSSNSKRSVTKTTRSTKLASNLKAEVEPQPILAEEWPRPSELPYQEKEDNFVNLTGLVDLPVRLISCSDGKSLASTVISQESSIGSVSSSPQIWVPLVFEGDLAHIAACHLKKNDRIHIEGQVFGIPLHSNVIDGQVNVQVMVRSLKLCQGPPATEKNFALQQEVVTEHSDVAQKKQYHIVPADHQAKEPAFPARKSNIENFDEGLDSWSKLVSNPAEWWDYRDSKQNGLVKPKHPDFKHKDSSVSLWINKAPHSVLARLKELKFDGPVANTEQTKQQKDVAQKKQYHIVPADHQAKEPAFPARKSNIENFDEGLDSWSKLVSNPAEWRDYRDSKQNGLVTPKHPDFKHKDSSVSLWINKAPHSVLARLKELKFDGPVANTEQTKQQKGDDSWKDLIGNPNKWWDNRLTKTNAKSPDFKHKETREGLWLTSSPAWVQQKLPPPKAQAGDKW